MKSASRAGPSDGSCRASSRRRRTLAWQRLPDAVRGFVDERHEHAIRNEPARHSRPPVSCSSSRDPWSIESLVTGLQRANHFDSCIRHGYEVLPTKRSGRLSKRERGHRDGRVFDAMTTLREELVRSEEQQLDFDFFGTASTAKSATAMADSTTGASGERVPLRSQSPFSPRDRDSADGTIARSRYFRSTSRKITL